VCVVCVCVCQRSYQSINDVFLEWSNFQVIKSLQDPLEVGNNLPGTTCPIRSNTSCRPMDASRALKVASQVATAGAVSAVYDCFVVLVLLLKPSWKLQSTDFKRL